MLCQKCSTAALNFYLAVVPVEQSKQIAKPTDVAYGSVSEVVNNYDTLSVVSIPPLEATCHMPKIVLSGQFFSKKLSCSTFSSASRSKYPVNPNFSVKVDVSPL